jgi:hypothetical protein
MASLQPRNSGSPILKFWEAQETITALEHVKGWLSKNAKKVSKNVQSRHLFLLEKKSEFVPNF